MLSSGVTFIGSGGQLLIDTTTMPTAVISGFTAGDTIHLAKVAYSSSNTVSVKTAGVVTISAGGNAYNLNIAGAAVGATNFSLSSATTGTGTVLKDPPSNASLFADIRDPKSFAATTLSTGSSSAFAIPPCRQMSQPSQALPGQANRSSMARSTWRPCIRHWLVSNACQAH